MTHHSGNAKYLLQHIIFSGAFLPFNLCLIKALIIHNTQGNFAIILQPLLLGRENSATTKKKKKKKHSPAESYHEVLFNQ